MTGDNRHIEQRAVDEALLDSAIDAVAREMTAFEPSGALRARVLERIGRERRHPSPAVPRWVWAAAPAAAAAALAVVTAVWVVSPMRTQDDRLSTVAEQRIGAPSLAAAGAGRPVTDSSVQPEAASPAGELAAVTRTSRPAAARDERTAEADDVQDRHPVPALAEIEPLRFASVEPAPLHIADVEISPITEMPSIDIPSLDQGSRDIQSADPKKEM